MEENKEENPLQDTSDEQSQYSSCSKRSNQSSRSSTHSSAATKARAKAEAARVKALYAQKEADMLIEQARIEAEEFKVRADQQRRKTELQANLHALKMQGAALAAITEAEILETACEEECGEPPRQNVTNLATYPPPQRTKEYLQQHSQDHGQQQHQLTKQEPLPSSKRQPNMDNNDADNPDLQIDSFGDFHEHTLLELPAQHQSMSTTNLQLSHSSPLKFLQEERCPFQTHITLSEGTDQVMPSKATQYVHSDTADLAKYLIHK